jgi:uncharacterized membrane protein YebE (DUF533 family)
MQMPNFGDLIGAFLQSGASPSGQSRMGSAVENLQQQGLGDSAGAGGLLDGILGAVKGGLSTAAENPAAAGGIGAVLGSLMGGGGDSVKGALGGGALAMLAGVAMKALTSGGQAEGAGAFSGGAMPVGLKAAPETPDEEQALEQTAGLVVKGMINAAKSDGEIGPKEMERIVGKLKESGMDEGTQHWVMMEMSKPLDLNAFVAEIPGPEAAAQVYAASLLAIEVDTDAERQYLQQLAQASGLNPTVVQYINKTMGVA